MTLGIVAAYSGIPIYIYIYMHGIRDLANLNLSNIVKTI